MTQVAWELKTTPALAALLDHEARAPSDPLLDELCIPPRLLDRALFEPLREALRPGKEFRGRLLGIAWQLAGGRGLAPVELCATIEALHLGSLIVDDIEDGSARRRGGAALHCVVGLPIALNAGNWLYFYPSVLIARLGLPASIELSLRTALDRAVLRCHYGQALDLSVSVVELQKREVLAVVRATTCLKTGCLMQLATELGAIAAGGSGERVRALARFGRELGVALQMLDDLSGITSPRRCHKGHEDLLHARPSWVWAWLAERENSVDYFRLRALEEAVVKGELAPEVVAEKLRERVAEHGRQCIRETLRAAFAELCACVSEASDLSELAEELVRLERYDG